MDTKGTRCKLINYGIRAIPAYQQQGASQCYEYRFDYLFIILMYINMYIYIINQYILDQINI